MSIDNWNHFDKYHHHVHYHQNHNHHHARKDRNLGSLNGFTMFYQRYPKVTLTAFDSPQCESCQDRFEFEASRSLLDEEGGTSRRDLARPGFTALLWHSQLLIWFVLIYFDLGSTYSTSILMWYWIQLLLCTCRKSWDNVQQHCWSYPPGGAGSICSNALQSDPRHILSPLLFQHRFLMFSSFCLHHPSFASLDDHIWGLRETEMKGCGSNWQRCMAMCMAHDLSSSAGNTFTHFQQIFEPMRDPKTGREVHKSVFVSALRWSRLSKTCCDPGRFTMVVLTMFRFETVPADSEVWHPLATSWIRVYVFTPCS